MDSFYTAACMFVRNWALQHHVFPKKTSFHAAALLHRGKIILVENKPMIAVNNIEMCAERALIKIWERQCKKQGSYTLCSTTS